MFRPGSHHGGMDPELRRELHAIRTRLDELLRDEAAEHQPPPVASKAELGLHVAAAQGRRRTMPPVTRPPVEMIDEERILLHIAPKDHDGKDVAVDSTWTSSDDTIVPLSPFTGMDPADPQPEDPNARWAGSGNPGTATIHVVAAGGSLDESIDVTVKTGAADSLNLSASAPVPE